MARQIVVEILGDANKLGSSLDGATKKVGGFSNVLKGIGMGIGVGAFNLATDAVGAFVGQLDEAAQAYREDQASQVKLQQALKNNVKAWNGNTDAIEEVITAQMRLGFGDEEQRESLGLLVGATKDVAEAQKWQTAAMDLARLKNIDLAQATDIVMKASLGNVRALKSVGISLDSSATSADAYAAIMAVAGGQAEAFANTSEGKQLAAQNKVGEAWEKIGSIVDQVSQVVVPLAADAFTGLVDGIMAGIEMVRPVIDGLGIIFNQVFTAIGEVIRVFMGMFQSSTDSVGEESDSLRSIIKSVGDIFRVVFDKIGKIVSDVVGVITALWNTFGKDIMNTIKKYLGMIQNIFEGAMKAIEGILDIFAGILSGDWNRVWDGVKKVVDGVWKAINAIVKTGVDFIVSAVTGAFKGIISFIGGVGDNIAKAARGMWDGIWTAFKSVINSIIRGWNSIKFTMPEVDLGPLGKVGGFTIGTPNLPYLHDGGIVPGPRGSDQLAILQAGERVIPMNQANKGSGVTVIVNIAPGSFIDGPAIDKLANTITKRMRYATGI